MRRVFRFAVCFVALAMVFGCGSSEKKGVVASNSTSGSSTAPTTDPGPTTPGTDPATTETGEPKTNVDPGPKGTPTAPPKPDPAKPGNIVPPEKSNVFKIKDINGPGTGGWSKSTLAASVLAQNVSKAISNLKATRGEAEVAVETPEGSGRYNTKVAFVSPTKFRLEYVRPTATPKLGMVIADGKKRVELMDDGYSKPASVSGPGSLAKMSGDQMAAEWARQFQRLIYMSQTDGKDAWGPLISQLTSKNSGYSTVIEKRETPVRGQVYTNYRVRATRLPEAAKKRGPLDIEIVVDGTRWLPVTIRATMDDPKVGRWRTFWTQRWKFNQQFDEKEFKVGS